MDDMRDLESLRDAARALRHDPDAAMLDRVRSGVRARIIAPPTLWDVLAQWVRPAAASLALLVMILAVALALAPEPLSPAEVATMTGRILIDRETTLVSP
jgi:hypothetical protein